MSLSARYVTQSGVWSTHFGKTLTNRTIAKYQRLGYYSNGIAAAQFKNEKQAKRKRAKLEDVFKGF